MEDTKWRWGDRPDDRGGGHGYGHGHELEGWRCCVVILIMGMRCYHDDNYDSPDSLSNLHVVEYKRAYLSTC
ncbi:hypothetical protein EAF00_003241 [Botryotinia globosa]|nr:hypothetical protein EAF00_003241 [Botryotinia globosa]